MKKWLTLKQAGRLAGMPPLLVLYLCRAGIVRAKLERGRWWVHRAALAPWTADL